MCASSSLGLLHVQEALQGCEFFSIIDIYTESVEPYCGMHCHGRYSRKGWQLRVLYRRQRRPQY